MKESIAKPPSGRPTRTPNDRRNKLAVHGKKEDFVYRFVNDSPGRVDEMEDLGYVIETNENVRVGNRQRLSRSVEGSQVQIPVGGGTNAFLMKIPKEIFEQDLASKHLRADEELEGIVKSAKKEGFYGEIKVSK